MQEVSLQYAPIVAKPVIHVSQYDVGRQFKFKIYDGVTAYTMPVGTTARVEGIKPDGHGFSYDDCVSVTDNIATVTTKLQMTIVAGSVECELRFSDGSDDIGTLNFTLLVEESPVNPDTDISDTEIPAIIELARAQMENAEAWAVGERNGVPVGPTDPTYHNNAKYYSDHAGGVSLDGLTDVDIQSLTNGQYIKYNSTTQKWENTSDVAEKTNTSDFLSLSNYGTQIPDNSDLNSYITPGKYYVSNGTSANTLSNAPTITGGFTMFVLERTNGPQRTQIIYMNNSGACDQYIRNHDTNTHNWSSWQKIAYDSQIQTLVNSLSTEITNRQTTDNNIISVISKNGSMNLLPNDAVTKVVNGVTFTVSDDGIVTTSGTSTAGIDFKICDFAVEPNVRYTLSGCPSGGSAETYWFSFPYLGNDYGEGVSGSDAGAGTLRAVKIQVAGAGVNMNGKEFRPMLTLESQPNSDYAHYVPYAKTNRELTEGGVQTIYQVSTPTQQAVNYSFPLSRSIKNAKKLIISYNYGATGWGYSRVVDVPTYYPTMLDTIINDAYSTVEVSASNDYVKVAANGSVNGVFFRKIDAIY